MKTKDTKRKEILDRFTVFFLSELLEVHTVMYYGMNVCSCCHGAGGALRAGEQQRPAGEDGPGARGAYSERKAGKVHLVSIHVT
jgi:hypothetical protein